MQKIYLNDTTWATLKSFEYFTDGFIYVNIQINYYRSMNSYFCTKIVIIIIIVLII